MKLVKILSEIKIIKNKIPLNKTGEDEFEVIGFPYIVVGNIFDNEILFYMPTYEIDRRAKFIEYLKDKGIPYDFGEIGGGLDLNNIKVPIEFTEIVEENGK